MTTTRSRPWAPARPQAAHDAWLTDQQVEEMARRAFIPHRCTVSIACVGCENTRKLALRITVAARTGDKEFVVDGVPIDSLRQSSELRLYLDDVRTHLRQRGIVFVA
jgi:hypothetical protein